MCQYIDNITDKCSFTAVNGLVDQGLVGHPVVLGRTPAKVLWVEDLPIERLFLPCKALSPTSFPLA